MAGVEDVILSRTGYTGEDGFELFFGAAEGAAVWRKIVDAGASHGLQPIGLGARDVLRLEAAMPLYGQELTLETNPYEACSVLTYPIPIVRERVGEKVPDVTCPVRSLPA